MKGFRMLGPVRSSEPANRAFRDSWFGGIDLAPLGLFRIVYGLLAFNWFWQLGPYLTELFSDAGMLPRQVHLTSFGADRFSVLNLFSEGWQIGLVWAVSLGAAIFLTIGLRTRTSAIVVFVALISFQQRNPWILDGSDFVFRSLGFWLIFTAAGERFAVDAAIRRGRGQELTGLGPALPVRILQLQVAWIYLATGLEKLAGRFWLDGTAVYYALNLTHTFARTYAEPLTRIDELVRAATWGTLAVEFAFLPAVFLPVAQPYLRLIAIVGAAALHVGILLFMNVGNFPAIMLAALILFLPASWIVSVVEIGRRALPPMPLRMYYDGSCAFCRKTAAFVSAVDVYLAVDVIDFRTAGSLPASLAVADLEQRMHAVEPGRVSTGFAAFARAGRRIPLLFPLWLASVVPGLSGVAERVYEWLCHRRVGLRSWPGEPCGAHRASSETVLLRTEHAAGVPPVLRASGAAVLIFLAITAFGTAVPKTLGASGTSEPVMNVLRLVSLDQRWDMFSPDPVRYDFWVWAPGELVDGTTVELIDAHGRPRTDEPIRVSGPVSTDPRYPDPLYSRWLRVHERVALYEALRSEYAWMYCRLINSRAGASGSRLRSFDLFYTERLLPPPGRDEPPHRFFHLWTHRCL